MGVYIKREGSESAHVCEAAYMQDLIVACQASEMGLAEAALAGLVFFSEVLAVAAGRAELAARLAEIAAAQSDERDLDRDARLRAYLTGAM